MSTSEQHPDYALYYDRWVKCRDCYKGEDSVKAKGYTYLPYTYSMYLDGVTSEDPNAKGKIKYRNYLARAQFHNYTKGAVDFYLGLLWHKDPKIELPAKMEPLRESITRKREGINSLLLSIQQEILITGRCGLLADLEKEASVTDLPYVQIYKTEAITNWDDGRKAYGRNTLNLVVLDETHPKRNSTFGWEENRQYRYLVLGDAVPNETTGDYKYGVFEDDESFDENQLQTAMYRGNKLDFIPFVFVNVTNLEACPELPPLERLVDKDLAIYLGEADYRMILHEQNDPTLTITGMHPPGPTENSEVRVGSGATLWLANPEAKAMYVCAPGDSLAEHRNALENAHREASLMSGSLTDSRTNEAESGDAMQKRMDTKTVSLTKVANTAGLALQTVLRHIAVWVGANPEEVIVTPNTEFGFKALAAKDIVDLQTGKMLGAPISTESIHDQMGKAGFTSLTYEEELAKIGEETPLVEPPDQGNSGNESNGSG